jgi:hypothetical protein
MSTMPGRLPMAATEIPPEWIELRREIIAREGCAVRPGHDATIEVQSINTGAFLALMLPGGGTRFVTRADRDAILTALTAPPQPSPLNSSLPCPNA